MDLLVLERVILLAQLLGPGSRLLLSVLNLVLDLVLSLDRFSLLCPLSSGHFGLQLAERTCSILFLFHRRLVA